MVIKAGKHQRSKQRFQDFCRKVHDRAQTFIFAHKLYENYVTETFLLVSFSVSSKQQLCFVHRQDRKPEQKISTKNFVGFHNHSPLLTMVWSVNRLLVRNLQEALDEVNR